MNRSAIEVANTGQRVTSQEDLSAGFFNVNQRLEIERPTVPCTAAEVFQVLVDRHPELGSWTGLIAFAIDERIIGPDADMPADTTVMDVLPPVSGG